ncbi:MAG TPA: hypothetical protein VL137_06365 [Polyangiaceae bacterium]|nr:hypothetical protein [Polyangiaceae bacterium]
MHLSASKYFVLLGAVALSACAGSKDSGSNANIYGSSGGTPPASGGTPTATGGSTSGGSGAPTGGTAPTGGGTSNGGTAPVGGTGGTTGGTSPGGTTSGGSGGTPVGGAGGAGGTPGVSGAGGMPAGGGDLTAVIPSSACANPAAAVPQGNGPFMIATTGTKDANCADTNNGGDCGPTPWNYMREYFVYLPQPYDGTHPYPLTFEGPGCGGHGNNIYGYSNNVDQTIIRVGLTPSHDAQHFHATNPDQGCFDDKEGDDSVDWVLYENLYDLLDTQLCFDKNRVFAGGDSSGAWFSNELGCKYAGDATRPVRGIMPNTGGLPNQPEFEPTCTTKPMAGFWSHEIGDNVNPFTGNKFAIARAMTVDACAMGTGYDDATLVNFPIGGGKPDDTCKAIQSCNPLTPLVVCALNGTNHASHADVVEPGVATFLKLFSAAPLK